MITNDDLFSKMVALLNYGCTVMGITGYSVKKAGQHTISSFTKPLILLHKIGTTNLSWQFPDYVVGENNMTRNETLLQEVMFQIYALKRETECPDTNSAEDTIIKLHMFLNGLEGIKKAKELGLSLTRITGVREPVWVDEGQAFEHSPNFDITVIMTQTISLSQEILDKVEGLIGGL